MITNPLDVFNIFSKRYKQRIEWLKKQRFYSQDAKVNQNFEHHIKEEWQHFLQGTYGLCTKSGLPEDIADKELAILIINEISPLGALTDKNRDRLTRAVNLLDKASAQFAPHERLSSSRHRLIDEIRNKFTLSP